MSVFGDPSGVSAFGGPSGGSAYSKEGYYNIHSSLVTLATSFSMMLSNHSKSTSRVGCLSSRASSSVATEGRDTTINVCIRDNVGQHAVQPTTCSPTNNMQSNQQHAVQPTTCSPTNNMQSNQQHAVQPTTCSPTNNRQSNQQHAVQPTTCSPTNNMQCNQQHAVQPTTGSPTNMDHHYMELCSVHTHSW